LTDCACIDAMRNDSDEEKSLAAARVALLLVVLVDAAAGDELPLLNRLKRVLPMPRGDILPPVVRVFVCRVDGFPVLQGNFKLNTAISRPAPG
jgi:hypothetical protein